MARKVKEPVRFAVVGLGHIAQIAVLPAFANAKKNARLDAFVSDDADTAQRVGKMYDVRHIVDYDGYDRLLASGAIDAVYIALPNNLHCEFTVRAAEAGVHVLCEKPMAVTEDECRKMITACQQAGVKLMIAYRLHFEKANLRAVEIVKSGELGEVRAFNSTFTLPVVAGNIRTKPELGGGTLYDIGVYCINAARYLFQDEPTEVVAASFAGDDPRFEGIDETTCGVLRFPGERAAAFVSSFGVQDAAWYQVLGSKGDLCVDPAYHYVGELKHYLTVDGKLSKRTFKSKDQFAPLLVELSRCIRDGREPEPNGFEGLADVRIIEALYRSAIERRPIPLTQIKKAERPSIDQVIERPPVRKPELVDVQSASGDD